MRNVAMTVNGNVLTIMVDLTKDHGVSKSGKTRIIASTDGNQTVEGGAGAVIGLNIYRKA